MKQIFILIIGRNASSCSLSSMTIYVDGEGIPINIGQSKSTGSQALESGHKVELEYADVPSSCINFTLLIGHWSCGGGGYRSLFLEVCDDSNGQSAFEIGEVVSCYGKCNFQTKSNWDAGITACSSCSTSYSCP